MRKRMVDKFLCALLAAALCALGLAALDDGPYAVASAQSEQGQLSLDDPETYQRINMFLTEFTFFYQYDYNVTETDLSDVLEYAWMHAWYFDQSGYSHPDNRQPYFEYLGLPVDMRLTKESVETLIKEKFGLDVQIEKLDPRFGYQWFMGIYSSYQDDNFFYAPAEVFGGNEEYALSLASSIQYLGNDEYAVRFKSFSTSETPFHGLDWAAKARLSIDEIEPYYEIPYLEKNHPHLIEQLDCLISTGTAVIRVDPGNPNEYVLISMEEDEATKRYDDYTQPQTMYVVNCDDYISLRDMADTNARCIARIPYGSVVESRMTGYDGFCRVVYNDMEGFVLERYLSDTPPQSGGFDGGCDMGASSECGEDRPSGSSQLSPFMVCATSVLSDRYGLYEIAHLWDGRLDTTWAEAARGNGEGEYLEFKFDLSSPYQLTGFTIWAGYQKNSNIYYKNSRPRRVYLDAGGNRYTITLEDEMGPQTIRLSDCYLGTGYNCVTLTLDTFYGGNKYADTCLSEIRFWAR